MELEFYVIHTKELNFRKENIEKLMYTLRESGAKCECHYITDNDPHELDRASLVDLISREPPKDLPEDSILKQISPSFHVRQVSNLMKHKEAIRRISESTNTSSYHIIIEDDVVYPPDISSQMKSMFKTIVHDYDILFIGLPATQACQEKEVLLRVFDKFNVLPCVDSYVITPKAAKKLHDSLLPLHYPTHLQFTYCINKMKMNAMFTVPNLFADGSKVGAYTSLLNTNNKLFLNEHYNSLLTIARSEAITEESYEEAQKIIEMAKGIASHPDMAYVNSVIEFKMGNIQKAYEMMKSIYNIYKSNGSIINHESEFLRMYIDIHKHIDVV
jgi:hypothetical protein